MLYRKHRQKRCFLLQVFLPDAYAHRRFILLPNAKTAGMLKHTGCFFFI